MVIAIVNDRPRSDADMVARAYFCGALEEAVREKGRLDQLEERVVDRTVLMQENVPKQL